MRIVIAVFAVTMFALSAYASQYAERIKLGAQCYADAYARGDLQGVIDCTDPRYVERMGGAANLIKLMRSSRASLSSKGVTIETMTIGEVKEPKSEGDLLVAFVQEIVVVATPTHRASLNGGLLAVSADQGATWKFVDILAAATEDLLDPSTAAEWDATFEVRERVKKAAQPGATDNPDDAQRSREDH